MVGLLHAMAFMVLLLVGWVIRNNKPLSLLTITTEVYRRNESEGTRFAKVHCRTGLPKGEVVGRPRPIKHTRHWKIETVATTANFLALGLHSHCTQYLLSGDSNSWIYSVLWRCPLRSLLERSWRYPFGPCYFKSGIFIIMTR